MCVHLRSFAPVSLVRGADAVGVTATVAVCGRSHDSSVAQRVMKLLAARALGDWAVEVLEKC